MDFNSIIGIAIALIAIFGGQALEGGHLGSLVQFTPLLIVLGGTLGAVLLQSPVRQFVLGMKMSRWVFVPPLLDPATLVEHIAIWSATVRKEGLLSLDTHVEGIDDPFVKKGLQLVLDGTEPLVLKRVLEVEIDTFEIAVAFVATIYGVGLANLAFLPIANKLKTLIGRQVLMREMLVDGLVGIAKGENPRLITGRLNGYLE